MPSCPICKSPALQPDLIGDETTSFICPIHNNFKVADTVLQQARDYTRSQWETALSKAKKRTKPTGWPLITINDF